MTSLSSELQGALLAGIASFLTIWYGIKKGFFTLPNSAGRPVAPPTFLILIFAFAIYIALGMAVPHLFRHWITFHPTESLAARIPALTWLNFLTSLAILTGLALYSRWMPRPIFHHIWLLRGAARPKDDLLFALGAWIISFPIVLFVGLILELFVYLLFHTFELPDQVAVLFLKLTFHMPLYLFLAIVSIVILAPLIEEFLFRGCLQGYLRRYLPPSASILISSACFSLFHYSAEQGLGNIPIVGSLFVLACFLGFVYERQGSLFASISLHAMFNLISVANLYFLGG